MPFNEPRPGDIRDTPPAIPLDAVRMAHTLRTDGDAWRVVQRKVCVRLHLPLTAFSVADLIRAHAALFPRHRSPLGPATGGPRHA